MCREESKAATAGADRFVSIAPCRSESADGRIAWRAQGDAGRGEDSARRIIGGVAGGNRAGAQGSSDRECAEPVQHREPQVGKNAGLLRQGGPRSEEHTSELQSRQYLVCRLLLEKKKHTK